MRQVSGEPDHVKEERAASIKRKCFETLSDSFDEYREVTTIKIVWDIPTPSEHGPAETLLKEHGLTDCNLDNNLALIFKGKGRWGYLKVCYIARPREAPNPVGQRKKTWDKPPSYTESTKNSYIVLNADVVKSLVYNSHIRIVSPEIRTR
jgi:hypothetical protein